MEHLEQDWAAYQQTCKSMAKGAPKPRPGKKVPKPKQQLNPPQELLRRHLVKAMRCAKAGDRFGEGRAYGNSATRSRRAGSVRAVWYGMYGMVWYGMVGR